MHISCGHAVLATLASAITLCQHTQYVSLGTYKTRVSIQLDWLWINLALVLRKTYFHQLRKSFEYNFTQPRIRWWKYKRDESKQNPRIGKRCIIVPYNWGLPSSQFNSVFFIEFVFKVMHRENGMYCMYFSIPSIWFSVGHIYLPQINTRLRTTLRRYLPWRDEMSMVLQENPLHWSSSVTSDVDAV